MVNLSRFPKENRVSVSAERITKKVQNVQSEVKKNPTETTTKYKAATKKHRHSKFFEECDSYMAFPRRERFLASTYNKLKPRKYKHTSFSG